MTPEQQQIEDVKTVAEYLETMRALNPKFCGVLERLVPQAKIMHDKRRNK